MITEAQIREQLDRHLAGLLSLEAFEEWLLQASWDAHLDSDESAQELAHAIELSLAEHSGGHLSDAELLSELRQHVAPLHV